MVNKDCSTFGCYDKYLEQVSPKIWRKLLRAKPYQEYGLLEEVERQTDFAFRSAISRNVRVADRRTVKSKSRKTDLRLRVDPSGFFSLSVVPLKKEKEDRIPLPVSPNAVGDATRVSDSEQCNLDSSPMGLSVILTETQAQPVAEQSPKRRARGTHGLTAYAKRLLVGGCAYLDSIYGKNLCFHTATLPSDRSDLKRLALQKSKEILKYWRKVLGRYLSSKGLNPNHIIICLELQKRGALHLHTVFPTKKVAGSWLTPYEELDQKWKQCLSAVVPELANSDFSASCRTERIKKSSGRYLAKYLSKSVSKSDQVSDLEGMSITWYSVGNEIKKWIAQNSHAVTITVENLDFENLQCVIVSAKIGWLVQLLAVTGYGYRCLFGYCDWRSGFDKLIELLQPI